MLLKSILITSVILHSYLVFFGQSNFTYDHEWKLIDSLMIKKNLPKSALIEVNKVYAEANFFFDHLPKGTFVLKYPLYVTTSGNYSNGVSTLECMYAPEFAAHSEGIRLKIESKL